MKLKKKTFIEKNQRKNILKNEIKKKLIKKSKEKYYSKK
jgi:hypothetical protein